MNRDLKDLREDYKYGQLLEHEVPSDPMTLFRQWFEEAQSAKISEPNAMTLATVDPDGKPSARIVLLKGNPKEGFIFFTNYDSRKGKAIETNPDVSVVFLWKEIERQVRIEGKAVKLSEDQSTAYYHSRPKGSQLGAWVSSQSETISDREVLESSYTKLSDKFKDDNHLPKPPNWGGYIILPAMIEFWQGRTSRLHDRIRYRNSEGAWIIDRLAP